MTLIMTSVRGPVALALLLTPLLVPATLSAAQPEPDAAPDGRIALPLDVMTFNIRTSGGRDGDNSWPHRKELVAATITDLAPHIVGLQEVLADQAEFLEEALPGYRWLGADRGLNGGRGLSEATPIFYRYDELVPLESGTFWLGDDPDGPVPGRRVSRIVTWARFHHVESGLRVHVFNTHFTLRRGRGQLRSAERINERIAALPEGSAVVVLGDFNALAERSDTWEVATSEGLRDAWLEAAERDGPALTSNGFYPPPEGREGRIDWILVGGPIEVPAVATIVRSDGGRFPSDHYPVWARLEIGGR